VSPLPVKGEGQGEGKSPVELYDTLNEGDQGTRPPAGERRRALRLILLVLAGFVAPSPGWPCTCHSVVGPETVKRAAALFIGKATKVEFLEPDERQKEPRILVTFEISEVWKGPESKTLRLRTTYNKWTCEGYYFKEGETYLVTAYKASAGATDGETELAGVNVCGGTRELSQAQDVLRLIGPGKKP
jgi:hypothetical protein